MLIPDDDSAASPTIEQRCLSELKPLEYSYYEACEGVDPKRRASFLASKSQQPKIADCMQCKVFECLTVEDPTHRKGVILFWSKQSSISREVVEEHLSIEDFNFLTDTVIPPLLWNQGSVILEKSETSVVDLTDIASLNERNTSAITNALEQKTDAASNASSVREITDSANMLTSDGERGAGAGQEDVDKVAEEVMEGDNGRYNAAVEEFFHNEGGGGENQSTLSTLTTDALEEDDSNTFYDGNEKITVHTDNCPARVLNSEKKLVDHLGELYDIRSGVASKSIQVGGYTVQLFPFHYPYENLEAPRNDKQRTYVDPNDLPSLFGYDWKNALCTRVQRVHDFISQYSININMIFIFKLRMMGLTAYVHIWLIAN